MFVFTPPLEKVFVLHIFIVGMKVVCKFIKGAKLNAGKLSKTFDGTLFEETSGEIRVTSSQKR